MIGFLWDYWPWVLAGSAVLISLLAFSYLTQNWRWLIPAGAIIAAMAALGRAHKQGSDYEREQLARRNDAAKRWAERDQVDVSKMSDDEIEKELRRWGR